MPLTDKQRKWYWANKQSNKINSSDLSEMRKTVTYVKGGLNMMGPWIEAGCQTETTDEELEQFAREKTEMS